MAITALDHIDLLAHSASNLLGWPKLLKISIEISD